MTSWIGETKMWVDKEDIRKLSGKVNITFYVNEQLKVEPSFLLLHCHFRSILSSSVAEQLLMRCIIDEGGKYAHLFKYCTYEQVGGFNSK